MANLEMGPPYVSLFFLSSHRIGRFRLFWLEIRTCDFTSSGDNLGSYQQKDVYWCFHGGSCSALTVSLQLNPIPPLHRALELRSFPTFGLASNSIKPPFD